MTLREKKRFVRELVDLVSRDILYNVNRFPDDWDGHELRAYVAERFSDVVRVTMKNRHCKRYREYKNFLIINNL